MEDLWFWLSRGTAKGLKSVGMPKLDERYKEERGREKMPNAIVTSSADRMGSPSRRLLHRETFHVERRGTFSRDGSFPGLKDRRRTGTGSMSGTRPKPDHKGSMAESLRLTRSPTVMTPIESEELPNGGMNEKIADTSSENSSQVDSGQQSPSLLQRIFTRKHTPRNDSKEVV